MLTLYYKPTSPYCQKVLPLIDELKLDVEMKDISTDETARAELIEKGGKQQVPYLVDADKEVAMYESDDIMDYLELNYGATDTEEETSGKPRVHMGGSTCIACEG
ncbi:glutaredoxin [bacterium]|nr:glutaredoxin [bacterium]|tara:strand:+ start:506 stop:820 length:315 start_codon:yes stop_codon:yes gene_type:complete